MPGEIAEMMLDGTLCEGCGTYMGANTGYPVRCGFCKAEAQRDARAYKTPVPRVRCTVCNRKVKKAGLADHMRDAHGTAPEAT